jgi:hypothetical protein
VAGSSGWKLKADGTAERSVTVRGDVQATSLNAATGTFAGTLTAAALVVAGTACSRRDCVSRARDVGVDVIVDDDPHGRSVNPGATGSVAIVVSVMAQAAHARRRDRRRGRLVNLRPISYRIQRNGTTIYSFSGQAAIASR